MADYPPESFGGHLEELERQIAALESESHGRIGRWLIRWQTRRLQQGVDAIRDKMRREQMQALARLQHDAQGSQGSEAKP